MEMNIRVPAGEAGWLARIGLTGTTFWYLFIGYD